MIGDSKIIIALDYDNEKQVMDIVSRLDPSLCKLKVGKELFVSCGRPIVEKLINLGYDVFLDLKFHDIPNTVGKVCKVCANMGVWMLNVHTSGGDTMMNHARESIDSCTHKPLLIGVTILTSLSEKDLSKIGYDYNNINHHVLNLSILANSCGLDGVVCSPHEVGSIKSIIGQDFKTITPGIRLLIDDKNDQERIMTPEMALKNGSDYLVIGRSITNSKEPLKVIEQINEIKVDKVS